MDEHVDPKLIGALQELAQDYGLRGVALVATQLFGDAEREARSDRHPNEQPGWRLDPGQEALAKATLADLRQWVRSGIELGRDVGGQGPAVASLEAVDVEITRRIEHQHVGSNLAALVRAADDAARLHGTVPAQRDADPDQVDVGAEALGAKLMVVGPLPKDPHMDLLRDLARAVLETAADEDRESAMVVRRAAVEENPPGPVNRYPNRVAMLDDAFYVSRPPGLAGANQDDDRG